MESLLHELHGHGPWPLVLLAVVLLLVYAAGVLVYSFLLPLTG